MMSGFCPLSGSWRHIQSLTHTLTTCIAIHLPVHLKMPARATPSTSPTCFHISQNEDLLRKNSLDFCLQKMSLLGLHFEDFAGYRVLAWQFLMAAFWCSTVFCPLLFLLLSRLILSLSLCVTCFSLTSKIFQDVPIAVGVQGLVTVTLGLVPIASGSLRCLDLELTGLTNVGWFLPSLFRGVSYPFLRFLSF